MPVILFAFALTACQTLPQSSNVAMVDNQNSKQLLIKAIEKTLYRNQDFIAEHQLYLDKHNKKNAENPQFVAKLEKLEFCHDTHDDKLVQQMQVDKLSSYDEVAELPKERQQVYQTIKKNYLECYKEYESMNEGSSENSDADKKNYLTDSTPTKAIDDKDIMLYDIYSIFSLTNPQIETLNNFVSQSGKMTMTGIYRPMSNFVALQFDTGFENKNLKYHYRVPLVVNWQQKSVYVKPDAIMPMVALYLDNQMGMSWQGKWYQFSSNHDNLPTDIISKHWLMAVKEGFSQLPNAQFKQINLQDFSPNIAYAQQKLVVNGTVIQWQQTAKQQQDLYTDVVNRYIQLMDDYFDKQATIPQTWQEKRQKLSDFVERQWISEPSDTNRLTGQTSYFVLDNQQLKQIYITNTATLMRQPLQVHSWVTFNPDIKGVNVLNTPNHLQNLVKTLHINPNQSNYNVVDGFAEIKRLRSLEKSRRLFGQDPDWLTTYENYQSESQRKKYCQTLKKRLQDSNTCPIFSNPNQENIEQMCEDDNDYQEYQDICQD